MATHVENLPDELLLWILDLLPDSDIIDVVPCVCLRWSRLSLDSHIWKNRTYYVNNIPFKIYWQSHSDAMKFFSRKPALRSVVFQDRVDEAVLRSLASNCPTITSLSLDYHQPLALDTVRLITRNCDQISVLRVPSDALRCRDIAREVALMPRLETLTVHGRDVVKGDQELQLRELSAGCARLRHLDLAWAESFSLRDLGAPLLGRLQGLSISRNFMSRDIVHCAESLEKLTLRSYCNSSRSDSALAEDLQPLKALTHVEATCLSRSPQVFRSLMQPLLRLLNLSSCNLNDDLLLELCRRCPLLEDLDLSRCDHIRARGLSSMWSLRRLRRLVLDSCIWLGSGAMTHLARCDGLQELRMQKVNMYYMEPGVSQLLELRKLRVLVFDAWSVKYLIPWESLPKAFPHLKILELGEWKSRDTSVTVPESLEAAMPMTQVKWLKT